MKELEELPPESKAGLVVAHLGQGIAVECDGNIILCQPLRKLDTVAVGDNVIWSLAAPEQGRIEAILPRRSLLARPSRNNKIRPVAANIDAAYIVLAAEPECDFLLLDQYLAVCENNSFKAVLVLNKVDLPLPEAIAQELQDYQDLGYPLHQISIKTNVGVAAFKTSLSHQVSILTGQSGVGKTSITNALIPDKDLKINSISATTKHGRHTTTAATLYHLVEGGDLIDSPGVAIFGLADLDLYQLAQGYLEFQPHIGNCQFNDCRHQQDKGCAIKKAVEAGLISAKRYQRFLKLIEKLAR